MSGTDPRREWVERVLGFRFGADLVDPDEAVYRGLRPTIIADLQAPRKTNPAATAELAGQVTAADGLAKSRRFERAGALLNQVAETLAELSGASRVAEAAAAVPQGTVAAMKARLERSASRWDEALAAARSGAQSLRAMLGPAYGAEAAGFAAIVDSYWQELSQPLRAGADKGEENVGPILQVVAKLRAEIAGDELLKVLSGRGIDVHAAYATALADVEHVLTA